MIFFGKARELNPFRNRSRRLSEMEMCQPVFKNFFLLFQTEAVGKMNDARRFPVAAIGARAQKSFSFCPCGFDTLFFIKKEIIVFIFSSFSAVYQYLVGSREECPICWLLQQQFLCNAGEKKAFVINGGIERRRRRRKKEQGKDSFLKFKIKVPLESRRKEGNISRGSFSSFVQMSPVLYNFNSQTILVVTE